MARRKKQKYPDGAIDMTPMIDVVFQLIIFFITAVDMESKANDTKVRMAMSPHGPVEEMRDPRTVTVDVDSKGNVSIARTPVPEGVLFNIMRKARNEYGSDTPVVIRADFETKHDDIRKVMDQCGKAGLWKLSFAALKEKA